MPRLSTGLRNAIAGNYGLGAMMNGGIIRVYDGTYPESTDEPPNSVEVARITTEGRVFIPETDPNQAGLILIGVSPGGVTNAGGWVLRGIATGTAVWWRWCWRKTDHGETSLSLPRIDGLIGDGLMLGTTAIYPSMTVMIDHFLFVIGDGA